MSDQDDRIAINQCLAGETKAFERLIDKYQKVVFNVALRLVGDYDDAGDVTQSVFIKAYESLNEYDPRFKFFSWVYKMAVNESLNLIKQRKPQVELKDDIPSSDIGPEKHYNMKQLEENVQNAISELTINQRVILILRYFADLSYRELGFILDISEKTVKSRLFSARQRLGDILQKRGIFEHG